MTSLVLELQRDALAEGGSVSGLLRKALTVARKLDVKDVDEWLQRETNGYGADAELPAYRILKGEYKAMNPFHGLIPVMFEDPGMRDLANTVRLGHPVAEIEHLLKGKGTLMVPRGHAPSERGYELPAYVVISRAQLHSVVDRVRNVVLDWALDLEKRGVSGDGMSFTEPEREAAREATHVNNFFGDVGTAVVQQGTTRSTQVVRIGTPEEVAAAFAKLRREVGKLPVDQRQEADELVDALEEQAEAESPKRGIVKATSEALQKYPGFVELVLAIVAYILSKLR